MSPYCLPTFQEHCYPIWIQSRIGQSVLIVGDRYHDEKQRKTIILTTSLSESLESFKSLGDIAEKC